MGWFRYWWGQPDHYAQLSTLLATRGLDTVTRTVISLIAGGLALDAVATIWTPTGPRGPVQVSLAVAACVGAAGCALLWASKWPTRTQAIWFAGVSNASIALVALAQSDPIVAMLTCTTFAAIAFYVATFHSAPLMVYNFVIATLIGAVAGIRIVHAYSLLGALCGYSVVLLLNLAVPCGIQTVVHVLGADAVLAEHDQLTGLLTRRAFHRCAKARIARERAPLAHFVVAVIDLDRFKSLNDRYGHAAGDSALVAVARALRDGMNGTAVVGRTGGEEFVIADIWHPDDVAVRAQQLCDSIAALPLGLTASLGTASVRSDCRVTDMNRLLPELISTADAAMYTAKQRGGNQTCHYHWARPVRPGGLEAGDGDYLSDGVSA